MELVVRRFASAEESTLGTLFELIDDEFPHFVCFTLEDQFNEPKVPKETRIPAGRYKIELRTEGGMTQRYGERFNFHRGMLWLQDVPNFTFVYIHVGNDDDDSEGCLLVGDGAMSNVVEDGKVMSSVLAYTRLYENIIQAMDVNDEVWVTIENYA